MKTPLLAALLIGASPAVWAQYNQGTNDLANTNLSAALADFTTAVANSPTDPNANIYLALTRLLALPNQPAGSNFLSSLGIATAGRNDYHWTAQLPEATNGNNKRELVIPNVDADQFTAELRNDIVPAMVAAETNLAQVTDPGFTLFLPGSVTHFADVTIDYGDVQMMRAMLDAATLFGYTLNTWNLDAQLQAVSNLVETDKSVEAVLNAYPNLLTVTNPGDQGLARAAFTNAINRYFAASQVIRSRPAGLRRLFNLDTNDFKSEQNFRTLLSDLESSVSAPFGGPGANAGAISNAAFYGPISGLTNHTLSLSNFFDGQFNVRALLPAITNNAFIWDSFPDTTLGGVITGLTETNLGKAFLKHPMDGELQIPGVGYTVLSSPSNDLARGSFNGVVQGQDGNFYGATPAGGAYGDGSVFTVSASGVFTLLYSFGAVSDQSGSPVDGGQPSGLVVGSDNNLYGATQWGGENNSGTIFRITPTGQLTTLYQFGQQADGYSFGGIPLVLGNDGNLYGTTPNGGDNDAGIIFQFIPSATGGQFTSLYSIPPSYGWSGAGRLIQGRDGYFYGVTQFGGDNGSGSIFQFIPGGGSGPQFNTLYSFPFLNVQAAFANPVMTGVNTLMQGSDGVLYGTTMFGGNDLYNSNPSGGSFIGGDGTLFSLTTNGQFTQLYLFDQNQLDGFNPIGPLVEGIHGVFYGMTVGGGGNGYGTIFQFTPGSVPDSVVWFSKDLGEYQEHGGYNPFQYYYYFPSVAMGLSAGTGGFYGTAAEGGANKDGTVFWLNVNRAPSIVISPAGATNVLGATVTLTVTAGGSAPLTYHWGRIGAALPADASSASGANTSSLTLTGLTLTDGGSYFVVITNTFGSAASSVALLTVAAPPAITSQPAPATNILQGQALSLQVGAAGSGLTFQWFANNVQLTEGGDVFGSATSNLVITPAFTRNSGSYSVIVANPYGSVTSQVSAVTVQAGTLEKQYGAGITNLTQSNINQALASFTGAVAVSPANGDANVYLALTRLLALPTEPAGNSFLNRLGIATSGRDVYHWTAQLKTNKLGKLVVPSNLDADEFTAELRTNVLPALIAAETNLAQITDTNFGMFLPGSVTHFSDVTIDYGDVQMMRAILDAATFFGYTLHSWNLDAQFGAVSNLVASGKSLTVQTVLGDYPKLLTVANPADQGKAGAAFTSAINRYFAASQFIRSRRAGVRLFNLVTNDLQDEQNFRLFLSDLESSMSAPFGGPGSSANAIPNAAFHDVISDFDKSTISMAAFFSGHFNVRSLFPAITNNAFLWDSFPDTTLDGLLTGLTETNLGKIFLKPLNAQLNLPGVAFTVLGSPPNILQDSLTGVVLGADGNLYGTAQFGGTAGSGAFFRVTQSGVFKVLHSFGTVPGVNGPMDGANPSSVILGNDKAFYGTTSYGGASGFSGTIFRITTNGVLTTVYNFGDQNDGSISGGNPLLQANDGTFYGITQYGGDNYAGVIFQFIPAPAGAGIEGTFNTLYPLPSNNGGGENGNGALVQGRDGYFYGVTQFGGDNGGGSIFQFIPGGGHGAQFNTLYSFPYPEMYDPYGNPIPLGLNTLLPASNGVFYGTAQYGGDNIQNSSTGLGDGFLFSMDTNGNFADLYSFDENEFHGYGPIGAMAQGTNGALYGLTSSGGANDDGTIFKFTPGGATGFLVWFGKALGEQQSEQQSGQNGYYGMYNNSSPLAGLTKGAGRFYGTAPYGGQSGNGTVFSLTANDAAAIVIPPQSTTNLAGSSVTFTVTAGGAAPLSYKWGKVGAALPASRATGAATTNLTLKGLISTDAGSYFVVAGNLYGSATSDVAVLTVVAPPTITSQPPAAVSIPPGAGLSLTVGPSGAGPYIYRWLANGVLVANNGVNISGAGNSNLLINPASSTNSGSYAVIVSNPYGSVTSKVSAVTVGVGPGFLVSPASTTNLSGSSAMFTVSASGTAPLHYQWRKNGTAAANNVSGATLATLKLANLASANAGTYAVVVTNAYGSATSAVALLTVVAPPSITTQPPATVSIVQGAALNLKVAAGGTLPLAYQWNANGVNLADSVNNSGSASNNLVINPASTNNSGSYSVVITNAYGTVTSRVSAVTVAVDRSLPSVTITSPASGARSNAPVIFSGMAWEDNVLVTNVSYWITNLNGPALVLGPAAADLTAGPGSSSNWTATVSLPAGSNVFAVRSRDFSGNTSQVVSVKFFLKSPVPLALTNAGTGNGSFTGTSSIIGDTNVPAGGAMLNVGQSYSITANHDADSFFVNWSWTGTAGTTNGQTLNFIMQSNTSLTANFVTNIFLGMAGIYNGLFSSEALGVTEETAGLIGGLILRTNGGFNGTVSLAGSASVLSGAFTYGGYASNNFTNALDGKATVELTVNTNSAPRTITASVSGTNVILSNSIPIAGWTSAGTLVASLSNSSLDAARYTLLIRPPASSPITGYGYALLTNNPAIGGVLPSITFAGALADGTPISPNMQIGEDNTIPVYVNPYTTLAPGLLFGSLNLANTPGFPAPSGQLTWIKKASPAGLFAAGFTNASLPVFGSPWSNSVPLSAVIPPNSTLTLSGGGLTASLIFDVSVSKTNLATPTPTNFSASINTNNGQLTVTVTNFIGAGKVILTGRGALLQDSNSGGGFFLVPNPTNAGSLWLQPPSPAPE